MKKIVKNWTKLHATWDESGIINSLKSVCYNTCTKAFFAKLIFCAEDIAILKVFTGCERITKKTVTHLISNRQ